MASCGQLLGAVHGRLRGWFAPREAGAGALPVRDHIHVGGSRPVRLMAFDQTLVAVAAALIALVLAPV